MKKQFQIHSNREGTLEGEKKHKKGGLNCVFKNFSFTQEQQLFSRSESDRVQSLSAADRE